MSARIIILLFLFQVSIKILAQSYDSVKVYTVKEGERIIYFSEHRLMIDQDGFKHLLFVQRTAGYYIIYGKKEYGPYVNIQFTESISSLYDWAVEKNGKWYMLLLDKGKEYGPYDEVIDVYRTEHYSYKADSHGFYGTHFGFRAKRGEKWYTILNGREFGPYDENWWGTPVFSSGNDGLVAYLKREYNYKKGGYSFKDSVIIDASFRPLTDVYDYNTVEYHVRITDPKSGKSLKVTKDSRILIDDNDQGIDSVYYSWEDYYAHVAGWIHDSGKYFFTVKKSGSFYIYIDSQLVAGPFKNEILPKKFSLDGTHVAVQDGFYIQIDEGKLRRRGFSLEHDLASDTFSWLSVNGRDIYQHYYRMK